MGKQVLGLRFIKWTRFRSFSYCKPLMFYENEKKIFLLEMCHLKHTKLVWYEIQKNRGESIKIQNLLDSLRKFGTATCVGSLLLLDGHNVIDPAEQKKKKTNKRKR